MTRFRDLIGARYVSRVLEQNEIDPFELYTDLANDVLAAFVIQITYQKQDEGWIRHKELVQVECDFFRNMESRPKLAGSVFDSRVSFYIDPKYLKEGIDQEQDEISQREYEELSAASKNLSLSDLYWVKDDFDTWANRRIKLPSLDQQTLLNQNSKAFERTVEARERQIQALVLYIWILERQKIHTRSLSKSKKLQLMAEVVQSLDRTFPEYAKISHLKDVGIESLKFYLSIVKTSLSPQMENLIQQLLGHNLENGELGPIP